jgi:NodT family efflux transporter outer membrane factor (OMF) lipoprotein
MSLRRSASILGVIVSVTALSACAPDLGPRPQPTDVSTYATTRSFNVAQPGAWPTEDWWKAYNDPQLNALMDEALAVSPDLKIAEARMREAAGMLQTERANLFPDINSDSSLQSVRRSLNQGFDPALRPFLPQGWFTEGHADINLRYELDFLGKNRSAFKAAKADSRAAAAEASWARLALTTSVASAYADLVRLVADRDAAVDAVRVRRDSSGLVAARAKQELENQGPVSLAEAILYGAQLVVTDIDGQIAVTRNLIAALLGKGPDRGLEIALPTKSAVAAVGVPPNLAIDLVGRRPDILAARLHAEAAAKRIDVVNADFYPNVDFTALVGYESLTLSEMFDNASIIGRVGPAIHLPIFNGNETAGRYREARAHYDQAIANYDKTVTNALREVADAIANQKSVNEELAHARNALQASENAYRIAGLRYKGGLSRYVEVLTAEDRILLDRRAVADLEARAFSQNVALIRALGGGFVAPNPS